MTATTNAADPAAQHKAWLKQAHPDWSIVHSSAGRWWGFLDTRLRGNHVVPTRTTDLDADTPQELHAKLAAAESMTAPAAPPATTPATTRAGREEPHVPPIR